MIQSQIQDFVLNFTSILWEAFPFIVLGALVAGILEELVPQQAIAKIIPNNRLIAISLGGMLGLIFPMCECGIVVVMRRLLRKGLPLGTCVAYMLAGPIINLVVITSTYVAFGKHGTAEEMVLLRVAMGFIVATTTGFIADWMYKRHGNELLVEVSAPGPDKKNTTISLDIVTNTANANSKDTPSLRRRIGNITETALHDFSDIMLFLILGAMLAAFIKLYLSADTVELLSRQYAGLSILSMMLLAIVLCLCSEADAFVAASFTTLHPSAKLAFLVCGPMFDIKLFFMFTRVFRPKLITVIVSSILSQVFVYSLIVHHFWSHN